MNDIPFSKPDLANAATDIFFVKGKKVSITKIITVASVISTEMHIHIPIAIKHSHSDIIVNSYEKH